MYSLILTVMITGTSSVNPVAHTTIDRTFPTKEACANAMNRAMMDASSLPGYRWAGWGKHPNGKLELCGVI